MEIVKILHNPKQKVLLEAVKKAVGRLDEEEEDLNMEDFLSDLWDYLAFTDTCLYWDADTEQVYTLGELKHQRLKEIFPDLDTHDIDDVDEALDKYLWNGLGVRLDIEWQDLMGDDNENICFSVLAELCALVKFREGVEYIKHIDDDDYIPYL